MDLHLEKFKVGAQITVVYVDKNSNRDGSKYGGVKTITGWNEKRGMWEVSRQASDAIFGGLKTVIDYIPTDGKGYYAMCSRETPHFFYSANPAHIKAARNAQNKAKAKRDKAAQILAAKRAIIGAFSESYRDAEENTIEIVSTETMEKLTVSQLKKIKNWLGL